MRNEECIDLYTPQGETLTGQPWNVYPRPQMKRDSFFCLNGEWHFSENEGKNEKIIVPFPPESLLSGINRKMGKAPKLVYRKVFSLPKDFIKDRVILHFGAVDQIAEVTLNGACLGTHRGGYEAFSFDVTEHIREGNELSVIVTNEKDTRTLPYGKQSEKRGGMWYTSVTGIWQTVWIESVSNQYIHSLDITTDNNRVTITACGVDEGTVTVKTEGGTLEAELSGGNACIEIHNPHLWSPEDPYLYDFTVMSGKDTVKSYFAFRTLSIKTVKGIPRLCLNGKPYFFHGLLDQGYYSDGIFTPATPECYENDIMEMKALGFNMLRKHIKTEPEQFYYDCDRLGMIVFQDMINNGSYSFFRDTALPTVGLKKIPDRALHRDKETRKAFIDGMISTVSALKNHPCICYWTIFNEGWGQFCADEMYDRLRELDTTRFIDSTSGWFKRRKSNVESLHVYFKPVKMPKKIERPVVLSEFGGYSYKPEGHVYNPYKTYGYRFFKERIDFENALDGLYRDEIIPAIKQGLCSAVYTQVSDVEDETNGLLSYDRQVLKVDRKRVQSFSAALFETFEKCTEESK
jgi:beta-galactosidase/beta-glucuronidase